MKITYLTVTFVLLISGTYFGPVHGSRYGELCTGKDGSTDNGCEHQTTFLYCYEGKCKCPDSHLMTSANLPMNLFAKWNKEENKCLAISGSSCGVQPGGNKMDCQPGLKCNIDDKGKIGTCGSSYVQISILPLLISIYSVLKSF